MGLLGIVCIWSGILMAQEIKVYLGVGGMYHSFQDARFSDVQYASFSMKPEIGFKRISDCGYWLSNVSLYAFNATMPNYDTIEVSTMGLNIKIGYLHHVTSGVYLGGTWDVLDRYSRDNSFLENGSNFYKVSSDVFVSGKYLNSFTEDLSFEGGLDYGIISFINSAPSFTANFPQNVVDKGEVSFMDSNSRSPSNLGNMVAKSFWKHFQIRTHVELKYRKRWSLAYQWEMRSYADHKGYPITSAFHNLMLRFNFISQPKN